MIADDVLQVPGAEPLDDHERACAAALAALDRMTPMRLSVLLAGQAPSAAIATIAGDLAPRGLVAALFDVPDLVPTWRRGLHRRPPEQIWTECCDAGVQVLIRGHEGYPPALIDDPAPAPVLFVRGSFDPLVGRRVGIVGTRNATGSGRQIATQLGRSLAEAGVHVVSGLARGIDGCAHRGALAVEEGAGPIGVVASGLDVVYPREHAAMWEAVGRCGALITEAAPGTPPESYRFPLRNRIIAGLSEILVVVESREAGGSLLTVGEAKRRDVMVMAVPGALGNNAAKGTNQLIRDGAAVVTDPDDVLMALGLDTRRAGGVAYDARPRPTATDQRVLDMCCEPRTLDHLTLLTGRTLVECAMAVARLEADGWLQQVDGWYEAADGKVSVL